MSQAVFCRGFGEDRLGLDMRIEIERSLIVALEGLPPAVLCRGCGCCQRLQSPVSVGVVLRPAAAGVSVSEITSGRRGWPGVALRFPLYHTCLPFLPVDLKDKLPPITNRLSFCNLALPPYR
ncbi:hypothetical protein ACOMHN_002607 [Nucella lapillus]